MITPSDLGLPEHFTEWRPHQYASAVKIALTKKRFVMLDAPTGTGKSGIYMAARALMGDARACAVTSTTALQDQLMREFPGVTDMRGQVHYTCGELLTHSCRHGMMSGCGSMNTHACPWSAARRVMQRSDDVVTNYAAWLQYGKMMGWYDLAVFDESHDAIDWLTRTMGVTVRFKYAYGVLLSDPPETADIATWQAWASAMMPRAIEAVQHWKLRAQSSSEAMKQFSLAVEGRSALEMLIEGNTDWACELSDDRVEFSPIDVKRYAEVLFRKIERVVFSSATMSTASVTALGVDMHDVERITVPAPFTRDNYRVWFAPVMKYVNDRQECIKWKYDASESDVHAIFGRIIEIVSARTDRRGIIHSVSYDRAQMIAELLRRQFGRDLYVYCPSRMTTRETIEQFREGPRNAVLVSPSLIAGHNFEYDMCRYQILPKLPWPDTRGALMQARLKIDKDYAAHVCMQKLVQSLGRGNRAIDDWCENFIIDGSFDWFWQRFRKTLAPDWFAQYMRIEYGTKWSTPRSLAA